MLCATDERYTWHACFTMGLRDPAHRREIAYPNAGDDVTRPDGIVTRRCEAHASLSLRSTGLEPARQTMQQGVEAPFGSRGCLAEEDAGLARNAASRVHLAGISQFLQRIEQQHDNAFLRRDARCLREAGPGSESSCVIRQTRDIPSQRGSSCPASREDHR